MHSFPFLQMMELKYVSTIDNEWRTWTPREILAFEQAIIMYGKSFSDISAEVGTRTTNQCVQFYYAKWKSHPQYAVRILSYHYL